MSSRKVIVPLLVAAVTFSLVAGLSAGQKQKDKDKAQDKASGDKPKEEAPAEKS